MQLGLIRLPIELATDMEERRKMTKATSLFAKYGWDVAITYCIHNRDMDSLSMLPLLSNIASFLYDDSLPVIKIL